MYSDVSDIFAEATNKDPGATDQEEESTENLNFSHENQDSSLEISGVALPNNSDDIDEEEVPHFIPGARSIAHCCAHGNNFYGYGGQVLKKWYLKPTKVHIVISI